VYSLTREAGAVGFGAGEVGALAAGGAAETSGFVATKGSVVRDTGNASRVSTVGNDWDCEARNAFRRAASAACGLRGPVLATTGVGLAMTGAGDFGFSATTVMGFALEFGEMVAEATCFVTGGGVATTFGLASGWGHSFFARASDFGAGDLATTDSGLGDEAIFGFRFEKAKIPPTPAMWIARTRMKAVVNEIPNRFFLVMVSRYSGSSIQCGCLDG